MCVQANRNSRKSINLHRFPDQVARSLPDWRDYPRQLGEKNQTYGQVKNSRRKFAQTRLASAGLPTRLSDMRSRSIHRSLWSGLIHNFLTVFKKNRKKSLSSIYDQPDRSDQRRHCRIFQFAYFRLFSPVSAHRYHPVSCASWRTARQVPPGFAGFQSIRLCRCFCRGSNCTRLNGRRINLKQKSTGKQAVRSDRKYAQSNCTVRSIDQSVSVFRCSLVYRFLRCSWN